VVPLDDICLLFPGLFLGLDETTWENNDVDEFHLPGLFPTSLYVDYASMTQPENIPSPGKIPRSGDSTVRKQFPSVGNSISTIFAAMVLESQWRPTAQRFEHGSGRKRHPLLIILRYRAAG
jgi:hypothetical protein